MNHQAEIDARQILGQTLKGMSISVGSYDTSHLYDIKDVLLDIASDSKRPEYERDTAKALITIIRVLHEI